MPAALPFVKWIGGKRQLLPHIRKRLPKTMPAYYEPMVGGGAVFFALANRRSFQKAVINDLNLELIEAYQALQDPTLLEEVITLLKTYVYEEGLYYQMRSQQPSGMDKSHRVARFLYLNKTCFTPGSLVLTEDESYLEIEKVKSGQRLWGGRTVQETLSRAYKGTILRVKVQSSPFTLSVTEDHPVLMISGKPEEQKQDPRTAAQLGDEIKLMPASALRKGDLLLLPTKGTKEIPVDWMSFWPKGDSVGPQAEKMIPDLTDEPGLCRLLGYYAAEGCFHLQYGKVHRIDWTFNKNETGYVQDVVCLCQKLFGVTPMVYPGEGKETLSVQLCSVYAARFIHNLVPGQTWAKDPIQRKTKILHSAMMQAPTPLQLELLKGWFRGDGGMSSNPAMGSYGLAGTSTVIPMARQMYRLAQRCGLRPSWWVTHPKTKSHPEGEPAAQVALCTREEIGSLGFELPPMKRKSCSHRKFVGPYIAVRVKEVTPLEYSGTVYNLEVDGDHLLCVDGVVSHNCFNGLYRVNQKGEFNAPFGDYKNPTICDENNLREAALALQGVRCTALDYAEVVAEAKVGEVVYIDPPYLPQSTTANFTAYTKGGFPFSEHERLASVFKELAGRGVKVLLSNTDQKPIRQLYRGFRISRVEAKRNVNSDGDGRGYVSEILVSANL